MVLLELTRDIGASARLNGDRNAVVGTLLGYRGIHAAEKLDAD